jgi:dUTP diphosphatase
VPTNLRVPITRLPAAHDLPLPAYMTAGAAGMDLHAAVESDVSVGAGEVSVIPTGLEVAIPEGYEGQIRPRSGLAVKHALSIPNSPATIDADYRGELRVPLINLGRAPFVVTRGMRIAQFVIAPVVRVTWEEVEELPTTARAKGGFGHSGL